MSPSDRASGVACSGAIGSESPGPTTRKLRFRVPLAEPVGLGEHVGLLEREVAGLHQRVERARACGRPARRGGAAAAAR